MSLSDRLLLVQQAIARLAGCIWPAVSLMYATPVEARYRGLARPLRCRKMRRGIVDGSHVGLAAFERPDCHPSMSKLQCKTDEKKGVDKAKLLRGVVQAARE
jgi:hypothetical protein